MFTAQKLTENGIDVIAVGFGILSSSEFANIPTGPTKLKTKKPIDSVFTRNQTINFQYIDTVSCLGVHMNKFYYFSES